MLAIETLLPTRRTHLPYDLEAEGAWSYVAYSPGPSSARRRGPILEPSDGWSERGPAGIMRRVPDGAYHCPTVSETPVPLETPPMVATTAASPLGRDGTVTLN